MAQGTPSPFIPQDRRALVQKIMQHYQRGQKNKYPAPKLGYQNPPPAGSINRGNQRIANRGT
jgi:hypothetical protein